MTGAEEQRPEALSLSADEAVALAEVAVAYAAAVPPGRDGPYRDLAEAAAAGEAIDGTLLETLERVCVLALETGKAPTARSRRDRAAGQQRVPAHARWPGAAG